MKFRRSVSLSARTYIALQKASADTGDSIATIVSMAVDEYLRASVDVSELEVDEWKEAIRRRKELAEARRRERAIKAAEVFGVRGVA